MHFSSLVVLGFIAFSASLLQVRAYESTASCSDDDCPVATGASISGGYLQIPTYAWDLTYNNGSIYSLITATPDDGSAPVDPTAVSGYVDGSYTPWTPYSGVPVGATVANTEDRRRRLLSMTSPYNPHRALLQAGCPCDQEGCEPCPDTCEQTGLSYTTIYCAATGTCIHADCTPS